MSWPMRWGYSAPTLGDDRAGRYGCAAERLTYRLEGGEAPAMAPMARPLL